MKIPNGTLLKDDKYKILSLIGEGGYSYVYKIEDTDTGEIYALKQTSLLSYATARQLSAQVNVLLKLNHKNLSTIRDYFFDEVYFYIVSDFVEGKDLRRYILEKGVLPLKNTINIIIQVIKAVYYLHHSQTIPILHRDIKPANIIVNADEEVCLVDFGLMKIDKGQETETIARAFTRGYSPVEQYGEEKTDVRSDIYSIGATLFFLLTGSDPQESISRIRSDRVPAKIKGIANLPDHLSDMVLKAMSINPEDRYAEVGVLLTDIENELYKNDNDFVSNGSMSNEPQDKTSRVETTFGSSLNITLNLVNDEVCELVVTWGNAIDDSLSFRLVRKYYSPPRGPEDGVWWDVSVSPFIDKDAENGKTAFYSLYHNAILLGTSSAIKMDEVYGLSAKRESGEITLSFQLPKNVKSIIIRKSYTQYPSNIFEGLEVVGKILSNEVGLAAIKDNVEDVPVFYTIFCRYSKTRSVFVTSLGRKIYA